MTHDDKDGLIIIKKALSIARLELLMLGDEDDQTPEWNAAYTSVVDACMILGADEEGVFL